MTTKIKKRVLIFLLIFIVGSIAGIVGYSTVKTTTFKECENSWLPRSITFYDYTDRQHEGPEKKCTLWTGKSFEEKLKSSSFGNDYVEKSITDYLLTQKYFSWKTTTDSRNFCVIENLTITGDDLFPLYVWVRCGEFILQEGKLKELSGKSVPAKINYQNQLSFYDISKMSHEVPRDGSLYLKDVKRIFPEELIRNIIHFDKKNINKKIESVALSNFKQ